MTTLLDEWEIAAADEWEAAELWERCDPCDEKRVFDAHSRALGLLIEAERRLRAFAMKENHLDPERPAPCPVAAFIGRYLVVVSPAPDELPTHGAPVQRDCTIIIRKENLASGE
jgi:hypothetical protein